MEDENTPKSATLLEVLFFELYKRKKIAQHTYRLSAVDWIFKKSSLFLMHDWSLSIDNWLLFFKKWCLIKQFPWLD